MEFRGKYFNMRILFSLVFMTISTLGLAQNEAKVDIIDKVAEHIKAADVKELSLLFDVTVELTIQERESSYSKAQAEIILKNFFNKYPPQSFKVMHRGSSEKGGKYLIGLLVSETGTNFRTSIVLLEKNDQYYIQQIRFE